MKPTKIELRDFLSFQGATVLDLTSVNAAVVSGANEAGKSSIVIDALLFALFGKATKQELIYDLASSAEVKVTLHHDGQLYRVERVVKKSGNTTVQSLKLFAGEKDISERLLTSTQKKLDSILKFSYNLLLSTSIAQQDEINRLSLMGPTDRERVLSEMLSLGVWEEKRKAVSVILNEHKDVDNRVQLLQEEINVAEGMINGLDQDLEAKREEEAKYTENKEEIEKHLALLDGELKRQEQGNQLKREYAALQGQVFSLENQVKSLEKLSTPPDIIKQEIDKLETERREVQDLLLSVSSGIKALTQDRERITKELSLVISYLNSEPQTKILEEVPCVGLDIHDKCNLLSNALSVKEKIGSFLAGQGAGSLSELKKSLEESLQAVEEQRAFFEQSRADLEKESNEAQLAIQKKTFELEQVEKAQETRHELQEKLIRLSILERQVKEIPEFDSNKLTELQKMLADINKSLHLVSSELSSKRREREILEKRIKESTGTLDSLKATQAKIGGYKTLQQAYNDIPTLLFDEAVPTLEQYTNEILQRISPDRRVQLRGFRETKSNTQAKALDVIGTTATGVRAFDDLSGSAKFRQSLALRVALARYNAEQNNIDLNLFIIDEGFGSLDQENIQVMKQVLKNLATYFDLFLIISHVQELNDVFPNQIIVNPAGKGKRVEVV